MARRERHALLYSPLQAKGTELLKYGGSHSSHQAEHLKNKAVSASWQRLCFFCIQKDMKMCDTMGMKI